MRCPSPPESVAALRLRDKYPNPTAFRNSSRSTTSRRRRSAIIASRSVKSRPRAVETARGLDFTEREAMIAERLRREVVERLEFLNAVGLGYLSLNRSAATL